jgi:hypothetical protein
VSDVTITISWEALKLIASYILLAGLAFVAGYATCAMRWSRFR